MRGVRGRHQGLRTLPLSLIRRAATTGVACAARKATLATQRGARDALTAIVASLRYARQPSSRQGHSTAINPGSLDRVIGWDLALAAGLADWKELLVRRQYFYHGREV